jgi:hypothetical protein
MEMREISEGKAAVWGCGVLSQGQALRVCGGRSRVRSNVPGAWPCEGRIHPGVESLAAALWDR